MSFDTQDTNYKILTPQQDWDKYLKDSESTMVGLMNSQSKKVWEKFKADPNEKGHAVAALEQFNATYPEKKWDLVTVLMSTSTTVQPKESVIPVTPKFPVVPFVFPANLSPSTKFFKDNYYEVTDEFIQAVKTDILDPIQEKLKSIPEPQEGKPKAFLQSINVETSCSTLPNGVSPDGKKYTFQQLSSLRNKTAKDYIISELTKLGVLVNQTTKVTTNFLGENKNGTSGPKWTGKNEDRPNYEQYKKLDVDLDVIFNVPAQEEQTDPNEQPELTEIKSTKYKINFVKRAKKGLKIKLPKIFINLETTKNPRKKSTSVDACPFF